MKIVFTFLLLCTVCVSTYCQSGEKFNFELSPFGKSYVVTLKSEEPISKDARSVIGRCDEKMLTNAYVSIIEKSIPSEKLQKLNGGRVFMTYSLNGKVLKIRLSIPKESINILSDNDLSTLFENLQKFGMDMTKIEIIYPEYGWVEGTEAFFSYNFPLNMKRK